MRSGKTRKGVDGYFDETHYPSTMSLAFLPSTVSGALVWAGWNPPPIRSVFTHLDIGCGDGIGLCLQAAAFPDAHFVGVDAMAEHIQIGQKFADDFGLKNIELICQTFSEFSRAPETNVQKFDYITAQGVIAWVSERNRELVFDIVGNMLADGGAFTVGYNSQPGWQNKESVQQVLLRFLGTKQEKSPAALQDVVDFIKQISKANAASVKPYIGDYLQALTDKASHEYMLHEFLNQYWRPLWFGEVYDGLAERGLKFACNGGFNRLREDFSLKKAQVKVIANIEEGLQRQSILDILQNTQFRTDIFIKEMPAAGQQDLQSETWFMTWHGVEQVVFSCITPAGRLEFDNPATREVLKQLQQGPKTFAVLIQDSEFKKADIKNAVETLLVTGYLTPVAPPIAENPGSPINDFLISYAIKHSQELVNGAVSRHGAVTLKHRDFLELDPNNQENQQLRSRLCL